MVRQLRVSLVTWRKRPLSLYVNNIYMYIYMYFSQGLMTAPCRVRVRSRGEFGGLDLRASHFPQELWHTGSIHT